MAGAFALAAAVFAAFAWGGCLSLDLGLPLDLAEAALALGLAAGLPTGFLEGLAAFFGADLDAIDCPLVDFPALPGLPALAEAPAAG